MNNINLLTIISCCFLTINAMQNQGICPHSRDGNAEQRLTPPHVRENSFGASIDQKYAPKVFVELPPVTPTEQNSRDIDFEKKALEFFKRLDLKIEIVREETQNLRGLTLENNSNIEEVRNTSRERREREVCCTFMHCINQCVCPAISTSIGACIIIGVIYALNHWDF